MSGTDHSTSRGHPVPAFVVTPEIYSVHRGRLEGMRLVDPAPMDGPIDESLGHLRDRLEKGRDPEDALRSSRSRLALLQRLIGPNGAPAARAREDVAKRLEATDRFEESRPLREQVADAYRRNPGDEHSYTLKSEEWFAINLSRCGMLMESRALLSHVLEVRLRTLGDAGDETIRVTRWLAYLDEEVGERDCESGSRRR